jgi:hypothetical protein
MKKFLFWFLAFIITVSAAVYQRMTGPTYPYRSQVQIESSDTSFRLPRSHETEKDCEVRIPTDIEGIQGRLLYKRFKTSDDWTQIAMTQDEEGLIASLPHQPAAGKLAYQVVLTHKEKDYPLTGKDPIVIRFKGHVPDYVLLPHILIMFLAMLFSTRAGIEALDPKSNPRKLVLWTTGLLFVGGIILGPLVQHFAFGSFWTGIPFGTDLTDNKTLIAMIGWIIALIMGRKGKPARGWVLGASALLLAVYLIPHSLFGSELDYSKLNLP